MYFATNLGRGWLAVVHPSAPNDDPAAFRNVREASLKVKGSRFFDLLSLELRLMPGAVLLFNSIICYTRCLSTSICGIDQLVFLCPTGSI